MKLIDAKADQKVVAVLEGNTLRFVNETGNYYAISSGAFAKCWESDKKAFDQAIVDGGRVFYPGDRVTLEF